MGVPFNKEGKGPYIVKECVVAVVGGGGLIHFCTGGRLFFIPPPPVNPTLRFWPIVPPTKTFGGNEMVGVFVIDKICNSHR